MKKLALTLLKLGLFKNEILVSSFFPMLVFLIYSRIEEERLLRLVSLSAAIGFPALAFGLYSYVLVRDHPSTEQELAYDENSKALVDEDKKLREQSLNRKRKRRKDAT